MQSVPISTNVVSTRSGEEFSIQQYAITFYGDIRYVGGFLRDRHDIAELLLKVELKIIHPRMQTQVYMYHLYD